MEGSKTNVGLVYETRGAGSGVEIDSVFGWMYEWRDGRATRFHVYPTVEEALEAARKLADE